MIYLLPLLALGGATAQLLLACSSWGVSAQGVVLNAVGGIALLLIAIWLAVDAVRNR